MKIQLGTRQIALSVERIGPTGADRPELIEATDRDIERLARTGKLSPEQRWEFLATMLAFRQ